MHTLAELASTVAHPILAQGVGNLDALIADNREVLFLGLGAILGGAAAQRSARAESFPTALGLFVAGLVLAALPGFVLVDATAALFAATLYVIAASAWEVYVLRRAPAEIGLWGVLTAVGLIALVYLADEKTAAFVGASVVIVFSALKVLQTNVLVHATIWLAGVLIGVAGAYLSLGAEFLAIIQVLIYVGAVVTLFLFTVMLTIPEEEAHFDNLVLPPGVTIESVQDLEGADPSIGAGPYKGFADTNPRKPVRSPPTLYGVSIADGVYGDETTERRKGKKKEA